MTDISNIKDEKPLKGPARMSKSEKCEAQALYKRRQRRNRSWRRLISGRAEDFDVDVRAAFIDHIMSEERALLPTERQQKFDAAVCYKSTPLTFDNPIEQIWSESDTDML